MTRPLRVVHVITGLSVGGAETLLVRLLARRNPENVQAKVISLTGEGPLADVLRGLNVPVECLGLKGFFSFPATLLRLTSILRRERPDVIQTWLYHGDFLGGLSGWMAGGVPVIWGIHSSTLEPGAVRRSTRWLVRLLARLSRLLPSRIVSCSEESRRIHVALGYEAERFRVIPNGFDTEAFRPDPAARDEARRALGRPASELWVGMVSRFHPQKDHRNFLEAAALLAPRHPDLHFVLCGEGVDAKNLDLVSWARSLGVEDRCLFLGARRDVNKVMSSLDVFVSASRFGEAFPLVVGEAMSCGVPCVVTDVGDSALLVGRTGVVVPPRSPERLAEGVESLLALSPDRRRELGEAARRRIMENYGIERMSRRYEDLYRETTSSNEREP